MVSRRRALHLVGAGFLDLAGCTAGDSDGGSTGSPKTASAPTETPVTTANELPEPTEEVAIDGASPAWARSLGAPVHRSPVYADGYVAAIRRRDGQER